MADIIRTTLDWVIPDDIKGLEIAREYRTTRSGRRVCFLTTQVVWYALRVYTQDTSGTPKLFSRTEHISLGGVQEQIDKVVREL